MHRQTRIGPQPALQEQRSFAFHRLCYEARDGLDAAQWPDGFVIDKPIGPADRSDGKHRHEFGHGACNEGMEDAYASARANCFGLAERGGN